ncbi:protein TIFY 4B-like isoform X5 [Phoenix dactylifera]|uniref:Protein TIFY n=1 Tax=Phoenix dactylifera TaxID=42345 RepID=A0A8B7D234_PHODC|nr:protein TIFY 4B-like isoform X5 [Phoenix dactylifera]
MQEDRRPESGSATTNASEKAVRSPLDKPLSQLTEEDIAQLTREDCRRFLKEKGMRRPSWNKSQAIQQVISLKALLEGRLDSGDHPAGPGFRQKPPPPPPVTPPHASLPSPLEEAGSDLPAPAEEPSPSPYRRRDPIPPVFFAGEPSCRFPVAVRDQQPPEIPSPSPRVPEEAPTGQMTIFYDGKVNVYSDVTADKARAIMLLAASRDCYDAAAQPGPVHSTRPVLARFPPAFLGPGPGPVPTASPLAAAFPTSPAGRLPHHFREAADATEWRAARDIEPEGPTSRKASLQRYREKRKDRFKGKKTLGGPPANMEMMYLSQKFRGQIPNEQLSRSDTSSPTQPRPPCTPTRCSSIEFQTQKHHISIDLNDDGGGK